MVKIAGYFDGKPADAASLAWLPVYQAELLRRKLIRRSLDVWQIIGGAAASAGTHVGGAAIDDAQFSTAQLRIARNMGNAKAHRTTAQGFDFDHGHGVLKGAPAAKSAKDQVVEIDAGGDGLRGNVRDTGPRAGVKWPLRTWKQGIVWAAGQVYAVSKRHDPITYTVTTNGLAGRQYPGVGPVKVRRKKGFKIRATATYTDPAGAKHVRTKFGTWYAAKYLKAAPAAPKVARRKGAGLVWLNVWGADGGEGEKSLAKRTPSLAKALVKPGAAAIGVCELTDALEPQFTKALVKADSRYRLVAHWNRLAQYLRPYCTVVTVWHRKFQHQVRGATEGALIVAWMVGDELFANLLTHLDVWGTDRDRVLQLREAMTFFEELCAGLGVPTENRSVTADLNDREQVRAELARWGFTDSLGARYIDTIALGKGSVVESTALITVQSDHPLFRVYRGIRP